MPIQPATLRDMVYRVQPDQKPRREESAAAFAAELKRAAREPVTREAAQQVEPQQATKPEAKKHVDKRASAEEAGIVDADTEQPAAEAAPLDDSSDGDAPMDTGDEDPADEGAETAEQPAEEIADELILAETGISVDALLSPIVAMNVEAPTAEAPTLAVSPVIDSAATEVAQPQPVTAEKAAPTPVFASPAQPVAAPEAEQQQLAPTAQVASETTAAGRELPAAPVQGDAEEAAVVGQALNIADESATQAEPEKAVAQHAPSPAPTVEPPAAPAPASPDQAASATLAAPEEPNPVAVAAHAPVKSEAAPAASAPAAPAQPAVGDVTAAPAPTASTTDTGRQNPDSGAQLHDARQTQTLEDRVNERINAASVARGLRNVVQQGGGSLTMRLTPHEMGTVRVQMQLVGTAVSAQFHTESEAAHSMLSQQLTQLRSTLESQGLSVERLNVQMMPSTSSSSSSSQASTGQHQAPSDQGSQQQQQASDGRSRGFLGHEGGQGRQPNGRGSQREAQEAFRRLLFNQVA